MSDITVQAISDMLVSNSLTESQVVQEEVCQLQKFMEQQALSKAGAQVVGQPLFISCPCKRCSPFTL